MPRMILALFLSGIALGAGPCMASCGPLLISYTAATKKGLRQSLWVYIIFSLSRIFIYLILGVIVGIFSQVFVAKIYQENFLRYVYLGGSIFIFLIGLLIILGKELPFRFCQILRRNLVEKDTKSIFIFGLLVGIAPCAPLIGVLSYIGLVSFSWLKAMLLSLSFGLGTVLSPLVFLVMLAGFINKIFKDKEKFYNLFQRICGAILCFLAAHLFIITLFFKPPSF